VVKSHSLFFFVCKGLKQYVSTLTLAGTQNYSTYLTLNSSKALMAKSLILRRLQDKIRGAYKQYVSRSPLAGTQKHAFCAH